MKSVDVAGRYVFKHALNSDLETQQLNPWLKENIEISH